jgi:hypothetical protein
MSTKCAPLHLDRKFIEDFGNPYSVFSDPDLFGFEIELEGKNILFGGKPELYGFWSSHEDGSLRKPKPGDQAIEYVFKRPLNLADTEKALSGLFKLLNSPDVTVYDSYRTSIHIHVNCLQETYRTIFNFITLAIIFDELLVSQNGDTRIGNNFCLRSRDAEGQITALTEAVSYYGHFNNLAANNRYSATNFVSLMKFATIEFRSLECTTDLERVMHWIKTLQALKVAARKYTNPREIISSFSKHGPTGFMIANLGDQYKKYWKVAGAHRMLSHGMRLAQDFAFCSDWRLPAAGEKAKAPPKQVKLKKGAGGIAAYIQAQEGTWGTFADTTVVQTHNPFNDIAPAPAPAPQPLPVAPECPVPGAPCTLLHGNWYYYSPYHGWQKYA